MITRRAAALGLALSTCLGTSAMAQANYPTRPVTIVVPFAPGGNLDILTRLIAPGMGKRLGQTIVVENKPGAGALIGLQFTARAPADGYTLAITATTSFAISPKLVPTPPYKTSDFAGVGFIAVTPMALEVNAASKFKSIQDILAYAKEHPGQVTVGNSGNGTSNHEAILLLELAAGVKFNAVAYKGSGPGMNDLLGGQIDAFMDQLASSIPYIREGKFRPLAVTTAKRSVDLPDVPTIAEFLKKDFDVSTTAGLIIPAKTPENVVAALNKALSATVQEEGIQKRIRELGGEPLSGTGAQFTDLLMQEDIKAADLVSRGLLKAD